MRRILLVLSLLAVIAMVLAATAMPAFAQGPPFPENPGQLGKHQFVPVGANDLLPLPFGGQTEDVLPGGTTAGLEAAGPAVVCKAPGSPFYDPTLEGLCV
jgi:hypothetical protein